MQKIVTFLTYNNQAEEAANLYTSLFKNSKITGITRYGEVGFVPKGTVMTVSFQLDGQEYVALNGGPHFKFSEGMSLLVNCKNQKEVDALWGKLSEGGEEQPCGWLKDKFGVSWQIIPIALMELMQDKDQARANRVMQAMLKMKKIDIKTLEEAADGVKVS